VVRNSRPPSDFLHFGRRSTKWRKSRRGQGDEFPELGLWATLVQIVPHKYRLEYSQQHAISSENSFFFWGGGIAPYQDISPVGGILLPHSQLSPQPNLDSPVRPRLDLRQWLRLSKVDGGRLVCAVRVYDCSLMAVNCGRCRATESRYRCGWCLNTQSCSVQRTCRPESWISRTQLCPDPVVTKVS